MGRIENSNLARGWAMAPPPPIRPADQSAK